MSRKELLVFANEFPYANYETYMETEAKYWDKFDKVYIFSLQLRRKNRKTHRDVPSNCTVIPVLFNPLAYILWALRALADKNLYDEFQMLINQKKCSLRSIIQLIVYISRSHYEAHVIIKKIKKNSINLNNPVFYSYRFGYQPYVALLARRIISPDSPMYCRAHGYDLYENRKKSNYIPMRSFILGEITKCFPVSDDGTKYLKRCYPLFQDKIETRYLGTLDKGRVKLDRKAGFKIVSCSSVSEVKRVNLIIDALSLINRVEIIWVHFGDGPLLEQMKSYAGEKLPDNIGVEWRGNLDNKTITKEYSSGEYHLFINTSSSEGLPVSIMEAISAGIPVIATDVGGTREIICDGINGSLMPADVTAEQLSSMILSYVGMNESDYQSISDSARSIWNSRFNADINYTEFVDEII